MAIGTLLAATVATPLLIQQHRLTQLRDENRRLAGQTEELADLQIENQRLSNQVAQASAAPQLNDDPFRELLRLRGEVGALRSQNRDLLARAATQGTSRAAMPPPYPQTMGGMPIANQGLATPESTASTLFWSILNADVEAMRALIAIGPDGPPLPPDRYIEESLERQQKNLRGVSDIRLSEVRPTDSEAETRLVYDLLRPQGELGPGVPTQLEVRLQNQGGEWKMVHTGWHADPMVETAVPPAPGEPVGVRQVVTPP